MTWIEVAANQIYSNYHEWDGEARQIAQQEQCTEAGDRHLLECIENKLRHVWSIHSPREAGAVEAMRTQRERADRAEDFIREVAWRFSDYASSNWSGPDILAHVADFFGVTVKELLQKMEDAGQ